MQLFDFRMFHLPVPPWIIGLDFGTYGRLIDISAGIYNDSVTINPYLFWLFNGLHFDLLF
jgi:hypothetical protein